MSFNEHDVARAADGRFTEKTGTPSTVGLPPAVSFQESPLSESDIDRYTGGDCNHLAQALSERLGWEPVIVTTDGHGWTHVAVRSPDGRVLDATGLSDGSHILDDDRYADAFTDEELEEADDVWLMPMPEEERQFIADDYQSADQADAERVADELVAWLARG